MIPGSLTVHQQASAFVTVGVLARLTLVLSLSQIILSIIGIGWTDAIVEISENPVRYTRVLAVSHLDETAFDIQHSGEYFERSCQKSGQYALLQCPYRHIGLAKPHAQLPE